MKNPQILVQRANLRTRSRSSTRMQSQNSTSINLKDRKNHEDGPEHSQNGKVKAEESHGLTADIFTSPVSRRVVFLADY